MMRKIINILTLLIMPLIGYSQAHIGAYYQRQARQNAVNVDSTIIVVSKSGSDANSGYSDAPFLTIQKAVDEWEEGKTIQIDSGVYVEEVVIDNRGTVESPILLQGVGINNKATVSGLSNIYVWDEYQLANGTFVYAADIGNDSINFFVADDTVRLKARSHLTTKDGQQFDAVSGNDLTDTYFSTIDVTGKEVIMQTNPWSLRHANVLSQSGSTITVDDAHSASSFTEFFVQNHRDFITNGFWWINENDSIISSSRTGVALNVYDVQIPVKEVGITVSGTSNVKLVNLKIEGFNEQAVRFTGSDSLAMETCILSRCSQAVYRVTADGQANGFSFVLGEVVDMMGDGIWLFGRPDNIYIALSSFENIGYEGLGNPNINYRYSAIECGENESYTVYGNTIDNVVYNGIAGSGNGATGISVGEIEITYNSVQNTNTVLIDGGGIYVPPGKSSHYTLIANNIVDNCERNIYPDNPNQYMTIRDNWSIHGEYSGLYSHENDYLNLYDNFFGWNLRNQYFQVQSGSTELPTNISNTNNTTFTSQEFNYSHQYGLGNVSETSVDSVYISYGENNNNTYVQEGNYTTFQFTGGSGISGTGKYYLAQMQALGWESNSDSIISSNPSLRLNRTMDSVTYYFEGWTLYNQFGDFVNDSITIPPMDGFFAVDSLEY